MKLQSRVRGRSNVQCPIRNWRPPGSVTGTGSGTGYPPGSVTGTRTGKGSRDPPGSVAGTGSGAETEQEIPQGSMTGNQNGTGPGDPPGSVTRTRSGTESEAETASGSLAAIGMHSGTLTGTEAGSGIDFDLWLC